MNGPPDEVLAAFGATQPPRLLEGGMGRTWLSGEVVLKPVADESEHAWVCAVFDAWTAGDVAVPRPLSVQGTWTFRGWGAHLLVPGSTARAGDDPDWFHHVHDAFHEAISDLHRPGFLDDRDDAWSYGDRVAWEGVGLRGAPRTIALMRRALSLMEPVDLPSQVIHGDLCVNVLRDGNRAGVIDWPAYHRPRDWALAIVASDAICWEDADPALLDAWDRPSWLQLVLRAAVYRMGTRAFNEAAGVAAEEEDGYITGRGRLLDLVEQRL